MDKKIKTIKAIALGLACALATFLMSCSQYALVNSEVCNNADLSDYTTFRIVTPTDTTKLAPGMAMVTYYNIAAAIREQMDERGFREDPNSPLLINIGITVHHEISTEPLSAALTPPIGPPPFYGPYYRGFAPWFMYPRGYYWPGYYDNNAQVITGIYREGVLTMDFINVPKHLPLYTASVATILEDGDSQFRNLKGINQAVQTLFSNFPVKLRPQMRTR